MMHVSLQVVEAIRGGARPRDAAEEVVKRIAKWYPTYVGALVALDPQGQHGAAAHGWHFQYAVQDREGVSVQVIDVDPVYPVQADMNLREKVPQQDACIASA